MLFIYKKNLIGIDSNIKTLLIFAACFFQSSRFLSEIQEKGSNFNNLILTVSFCLI